MSQYCPSCGEELSDEVGFCSNCGTKINGLDLNEDAKTDESVNTTSEKEKSVEANEDGWQSYLADSWRIGVSGVFMGLIAGALIAWSLSNIGGSIVGFLMGFVGVTVHLWQKRTATGVLGSGLYITALLLILVPIFFYGGMLAEVGDDPGTAEEVGMAVGGVLGLVIWGFVFTLIAVVVAAIGYFFKKRESRKLHG